uniref:Uncharacterized protein n=1 Tax=Anguilla anguilla TaxID=7936 RepID=A0A0E9WB67_ANGAN
MTVLICLSGACFVLSPSHWCDQSNNSPVPELTFYFSSFAYHPQVLHTCGQGV